jgi:glutamyl-tRNA reductase
VGQVQEAYEYAKRTHTTTSKLNTHFIGELK